MHLNVSSGKWRPFCLDLNVLILSPVGAPQVVVMTTCDATSEDKVGIMHKKALRIISSAVGQPYAPVQVV